VINVAAVEKWPARPMNGGLRWFNGILDALPRPELADIEAIDDFGMVRDLARGADVFLQNFRPGVVDRLGLGESDIRQVAPQIICTPIRGFGDEGPWVGKPVYDPIIQAVSGLTTIQAGSAYLSGFHLSSFLSPACSTKKTPPRFPRSHRSRPSIWRLPAPESVLRRFRS
jgi:CoA-transferase family III